MSYDSGSSCHQLVGVWLVFVVVLVDCWQVCVVHGCCFLLSMVIGCFVGCCSWLLFDFVCYCPWLLFVFVCCYQWLLFVFVRFCPWLLFVFVYGYCLFL